MRYINVRNASTQSDLGTRVGVADNFFLRLRGMIARPKLEEGQGLLIKPCQAVHMQFMSQPLDVVMVSALGRVLALYPNLQPRDKTKWHGAARYAIELPPGTISRTDTRVGDEVTLNSHPLNRNGRRRRDVREGSGNRQPQNAEEKS